MKAILMSIQPKWLVKILNGEKTIEIRKSMPKCELPIDVYLYCTKGKPLLRLPTGNKEWFIDVPFGWVVDKKSNFNGKVVAKFTLNKVGKVSLELIDPSGYDEDKEKEYVSEHLTSDELTSKSCHDEYYIDNYLLSRSGYAWHIDNLVVFDKPKELHEFSIFKRETITCGWEMPTGDYMDCPPYTDWVEYRVYKAPQSWQYAYVEGEK